MEARLTQPLFALPVKWDFPCRTNSDYGEELSFQDGAEFLDLTGYTFQMDVKRSPESSSVDGSFSMAGSPNDEGFWIIDPTQGAVQVRFMWENIKAMFDGVFPDNGGNEMSLYYDLLVTEPDGFRTAWLYGDFILNKGITNG